MTDLRKAAEKMLHILDNEPSSFTTWVDDMRIGREELRYALVQSEWTNLTDEEIGRIYKAGWSNNQEFARAIEAKLKEKNQ